MRLSRIVADLLDLSRLESGSELDGQRPSGRARRDEVTRGSSDAATRRASRSAFDVDPVPAVRGSARDLSLLVRNLLDNAIRYTRRRRVGHRVASASDNGSRRRSASTDTGIGIPHEGPAPRVRTLLPGRPRPVARDRRHRTRPGDRPPRRREPRGHGDGASELGQGSTFEVRCRLVRPVRRPGQLCDARVCCRADDHPLPDPSRPHRRRPARRSTAEPRVIASTTAARPRPRRSLERFAAVRLTAVYSSPLDRCVQTVAPLARGQRLEVVAATA